MKKTAVKIFSFLLMLCIIIFQFSFVLLAKEDSGIPDTSKAGAVCLYNLNTDKNVYASNLNQRLFPTGAVKMMTGLLACEMLSERMSEAVLITEQMLHGAVGANVKLKAGMSVTVENLLYGVLCGGGNDAALALATLCSGSADAFVAQMNSKALEWGLKNTHFTNPTGIDDQDMYSTLSDIMILAKRAAQSSTYLKISSAMSYIYTPIGTSEEIKFYNRNALISNFYSQKYRNPNAQGLICGNTDLGGYCVISFAEKKGTSYICAVMGGVADDNDIYSYKIANSLFDYAFDNLQYAKIAESGMKVCEIPTEFSMPQSGGEQASVACVIKNDVYALTYKQVDVDSDLQYEYYLHNDSLCAPMAGGVVVGGVDILYNGEIIGQAKLVTSKSVEASGILLFLNSLREFFSGRAFVISLLSFIVLFFIYCHFFASRLKRREVKKIKEFK